MGGLLVIGVRGLRLGVGLNLNGASVWWSGIGLFGREISIVLLDSRVGSVSENGGECPDNLILVVNLDSRLVWWPGVGLGNGVVSIILLDGGVQSVVLNGLEGPDWLLSGSEAKKASNGK